MKFTLLISLLSILITACTPNTDEKKNSLNDGVQKNQNSEPLSQQQVFLQKLEPLILNNEMSKRFNSGTREDEGYWEYISKQRTDLINEYSNIKDWDCFAYGTYMPQDVTKYNEFKCGVTYPEVYLTAPVTFFITLTDAQASSIKKIYAKDKIRFSGGLKKLDPNLLSGFEQQNFVKLKVVNPTSIEIVK